MTRAEQVRQALAALAGQHGPAATAIGRVTAVNESALTCTVDDGDGLPWYDVRLMPLLQVAEGMVLIPQPGAWCLLQRIEGGEDWCVVWASALQAWKLQAGPVRLQADNNGLLLSKGTDGLREILTDLIAEIQAIYAPKNVAALAAIRLRIESLLKSA
jgi:hypothetical protein